MSLLEAATDLLGALARADLERARDLCAEDVLLFGTDEGELWRDRESALAAVGEMRELELRAQWRGPPSVGDNWVAGVADFMLKDGTTLAVRVTMVFADEKLVHGHYSVASRVPSA